MNTNEHASITTACGVIGRSIEELTIGTAAYLCPKCSGAADDAS